MESFTHTLAAMNEGYTRRVYGTAYWSGEKWFAKIGDSLLDCRWLDPIQPLQGGKIVIDITNDGQGQSTALVIGGYTDQPRPSTGSVLIVGVTEIVFTGEDSSVYTTDRFIGTYLVGDLIYITWDAATPTIIGKIPTITVTPEAPPPPPPPTAATGEVSLITTASDTYGVGGWGRWATSQGGGEDVYSGTWGGYTVTGAWFYGAPRPELQGKTITRIRWRRPGRMNVGGSGSATIHVYAHNSGARPGGDVSRVAGPFDISVPQGAGPGWHDLSLSFAPTLVAGGGISIAGDPYVAFNSRLDDPEAGQLLMSWSA